METLPYICGMENKNTMTYTNKEMSLISEITYLLNEPCHSYMEEYKVFGWCGDFGEVTLVLDEGIIKMIDFTGSLKLSFALEGLAKLRELETGDYYTD
jgi:hypothetical protein